MCPRGERTLPHIAYAIAAVLTASLGRLSWWETKICTECEYVVSLYHHWDRGDYTAMLNWFREKLEHECVYVSIAKILYAKGWL